ncbi:cytochrome P450 [Lanmaoa asiatica]|nr:cytochrome P450 [Lanmaoa asiatica]
MIPVGKLLLAAFASVTAFGLWKFFQFAYHQFTSPLRQLRGPQCNKLDLWKSTRPSYCCVSHCECAVLQEEWVRQYGSTLTYKGAFCKNQLFTVDARAINYVLTHSSDYQKPWPVRYQLVRDARRRFNCRRRCSASPAGWHPFSSLSLLTANDPLSKQRRVMNPGFGPAQIRALTNIFLEKAVRLRDTWSSEIAKDPAGTTSGARLDVIPWLSRMTLDIIGLAGFNYNIDALKANERPNELNEAFATMTAAGHKVSILPALQARPAIVHADSRSHRTQWDASAKNYYLVPKLVARESATEKGDIEKNSLRGRDLLSLLVKANIATDVPESQRLSDEDVLAQVPTFLVAGHETTSTAATWALYAITVATRIQTKLREELLSVETENPSMDELMALPYLDAVVRETLRVYSPIPATLRVAMKDDVVPVEKPFADRNGVIHDSIRPERWENIPEAVSQIPGVWGHLLTFLGGPRACIGYRFSIVETKAILFTLVRAFEFELAVPVSKIGRKHGAMQQPFLRGDPKSRAQFPLLLKPYKWT